MFDSLPATLADLTPEMEAEASHMLEDFMSPAQIRRHVTEDFCFICSRATDHRGEDHVATQELVLRFAAAAAC